LDSFLETFDDFIDDLLCTDEDLLKGELDLLIFQHIMQSIDLKFVENKQSQSINSLAA